MDNSKLRRGAKFSLPVIDRITDGEKFFYKVEKDGKTHLLKLFKFQESLPTPKSVNCIIHDVKNGHPHIGQDIAYVIKQVYTTDGVYSFNVRLSTSANSYYTVVDSNGLVLRLPRYNDVSLVDGQEVQCKLHYSGNNPMPILTLVETDSDSQQNEIQFFGIQEAIDNISICDSMREYILENFDSFDSIPELQDAYMEYDQSNWRWIFTALHSIAENLPKWLSDIIKNKKAAYIDEALKLCVFYLEKSDLLMQVAHQERAFLRTRLSRDAEKIAYCKEAFELHKQNKVTRYMDDVINSLDTSCFLYQPERKLYIMMCLFNVGVCGNEKEHPEFSILMQRLLNAIIKGGQPTWTDEPFRSAFVEQIQAFILTEKREVNFWTYCENENEEQRVRTLIVALAVQLLLCNPEHDSINPKENYALMLRMLTIINNVQERELLKYAYNQLACDNSLKLQYTWNDVSEIPLLAMRELAHPAIPSDSARVFEGEFANIEVQQDALVIVPHSYTQASRNILPDNLFRPINFQILFQKDECKFNPRMGSGATLKPYDDAWNSVESTLFLEGEKQQNIRRYEKRQPVIGEWATIRITGLHSSNNFNCIIEDDTFEGTGRIAVQNIVSYDAHADTSCFSSINGKPMRFKAKVQNIVNGEITFTLKDVVDNFIIDNVDYSDEVVAIITGERFDVYMGVSEYGYSVEIPKEDCPMLHPGNYVKLCWLQANQHGTVRGAFKELVAGTFDVRHAFCDMLYTIAEEIEEEEEVDYRTLRNIDEYIDRWEMRELLLNIDRLVTIERDRISAYNTLRIAAILARIINDDLLVEYFRERYSLIKLMDEMVRCNSVNVKDIREHEAMSNRYRAVNKAYMELLITSYLDNPSYDLMLLNFSAKAPNNPVNYQFIKLAKLVLSYNQLRDLNLEDERKKIKQQVFEMLHYNSSHENVKGFGNESEQCEFKTSIVFPADNNMQPDVATQTKIIMQSICAMINANGGVLYLGVNDSGFATGLDNDIRYFGSLDKLLLHIDNAIVDHLGKYAGSLISRSVVKTDKGEIVQILIEQSLNPIYFDKTEFWQRQGNRKVKIEGADLALVIDSRKRRQRENSVRISSIEKTQRNIAIENNNEQVIEVNQAEQQPVAVSVATPAPQPVDVEDNTPTTAATDDDQRVDYNHVGTFRSNVLFDYEEGFVPPLFYINFLNNNKMQKTDNPYSDNADIIVALQEEESELNMIMLYESGKVLKVPMHEIIEKQNNRKYNIYEGERLVFASPARDTDVLIQVLSNDKEYYYCRANLVSDIDEGKINDSGRVLTTVPFRRVEYCDLVPGDRVNDTVVKWYTKNNEKSVGQPMKQHTVQEAVDAVIEIIHNV